MKIARNNRMKMHRTIGMLLLVAGLLLGIANNKASAAVVIQDTFSGANGSAIVGRTPDTTDLPGGTWSRQGDAGYELDIQGNKAKVGADAGAIIPISSAGGYTKLNELTISVTFNMATVVGGDFFPFFGVGLGFTDQSGGGGAFSDFTGLLVRTNGALRLLIDAAPSGPDAAYTGTFDQTIDHTLIYTVDTMTGAFLGINIDGQGKSITTTAFTDARTAFAGFFTSSSDGNPTSFGLFDDFLLTQIPEPSAVLLLSVGGLLLWRRAKK